MAIWILTLIIVTSGHGHGMGYVQQFTYKTEKECIYAKRYFDYNQWSELITATCEQQKGAQK